MSSFQELYRKARAKAFEKPKKAAAEKKKQSEPAMDPAKKAKDIIKARKAKRLEEGSDEPKIDYAPRTRSSHREKPLPTRALNLDTLMKVQVNSKTWVYVHPDSDIEAVKAKYNKLPTMKDKEDAPPKYDF